MVLSHAEILAELQMLLEWQHIMEKKNLVKGIENLKKKIEDRPCNIPVQTVNLDINWLAEIEEKESRR